MRKEKSIQSSLHWYLLGGLCAFLFLYLTLQYMIFKKEYDQNFLKEASSIEHTFRSILENYKTTLETLSKEMKGKNLFADKKSIVDYLNKAYAYGVESENREKVRTLGVNWIGIEKGETHVIGRLGEVQYKLNFTPEYLKKLEKNVGTLEISNALHTENSPDFSLINLGIGVRDNAEQYRGFVNARIDMNALIEVLSSKSESGLHFTLLDEKGNEIVSSLPEENSSKNYVFPIHLPVNGFSYALRFGYDQNQFYVLFLKQAYPYFFLLCLFLCPILLFAYFYHKKLIKKSLGFYKQTNREKNIKIDQLTEEIHSLTAREQKLEKYIKSAEEGDKEEKRFCLEINKRVSHSLSNMLDIANFLLNRIQEDNKIEEDPKDLMDVFESTYIHSRFFTLKCEEELVSINDVLDEAIAALSKQALKKELHIKYMKESIPSILTDKMALKQALINILGRAIKNSPKKGEINLTLLSHEEKIFLECKDNGYIGELSLKEESSHDEKESSLDCMSLEKEDLEKLVKSLGGTLSSRYKPYQGNTFLLELPYQMQKNQESINGNDNIVSFTILKKKR